MSYKMKIRIRRKRKVKFVSIAVGIVGLYPDDVSLFEMLCNRSGGISAGFREAVHAYVKERRNSGKVPRCIHCGTYDSVEWVHPKSPSAAEASSVEDRPDKALDPSDY